MWMYLVDADTVIISEFLPGENATAIAITNNAAQYMEDLGYEVFRVPDHNGFHPSDPNCHYTYTNAFRVNDRIFIPVYGGAHAARDAQAMNTWQDAAPDAKILRINSYNIIWAAGAIHCIVMQVPRYTEPVPAAHVVSPTGGELLVGGTSHDLSWAASDDLSVTAVDLAYSTDGGTTFPHTIAAGETNDGHFDWTVPDLFSPDTVVRAVAHDGDGNFSEAVSETAFTVSPLTQTIYDFSTGAGVDKWGWGYQTPSWSSIDGIRHPSNLASEIAALQAGAYGKIAVSDATGGDTDADRYRSPNPTSGWESTHTFEFTIAQDPVLIRDIGILWEGYGDQCLQMELYVWDDVEGNWGDGTGLYGINRFMDNFAGNRDEELSGHIRSAFDRYIDGSGMLTVLLYAERSTQESFHDYVSVTVTSTVMGDLNDDGLVGVGDLLILLGAWGPCPPGGDCTADLDGDGSVGVTDLLILLGAWS